MSDAVPAPAAAAEGPTLPADPLEPSQIPEKFAKHCDPQSPPPMRMMAARAMVPMGPKEMVPIVYQLTMDPDPKIAALARKTFAGLDDRILNAVLGDQNLPTQILHAFCFTLIPKPAQLERVLINKGTPDAGFVHAAEFVEDERVIGVIVENQERLLRTHDIARGLAKNPKVLRSDLDKAVDFLVREGVFLDDVQAFEDSFMRLGKADMLSAVKKIKITESDLDERERQAAAEAGLSAEEFKLQGRDLDESEVENILEDQGEAGDGKRKRFQDESLPVQIKRALSGPHEDAITALKSTNRMVAVAGIRNPKVNDSDVTKIARNKSMFEDVIREICSNGDWTKAYGVKLSLVMNPKTPPMMVMRWLPLMRQNDLRALSKSKQIPSNVQQQAKRLMDRKA